MIRRRDFITLIGGAATWPLAARVQKAFVSAFIQGLAGLGWTDGRNVRMDLRWGGGDANRIRAFAQELVGLQPDIIVTGGTLATAAVQRETRTIPVVPVVFANVADPVASGLVATLNRPGGNITGFAIWEASMGGKWLELLTSAPGITRQYGPHGTPTTASFRKQNPKRQTLAPLSALACPRRGAAFFAAGERLG